MNEYFKQVDLKSPDLWSDVFGSGRDRMLFRSLSLIMITVTILYRTGQLTELPCQNDIVSNTIRNFIHIDIGHILSNLVVFYLLTKEISKKKTDYLVLILVITSLIVVLDTVYLSYLDSQNIKVPCSIGFSGVLYGLLAWNILTDKTLSMESIITIAIFVIEPSLTSENISFSGHALGALAGVVSYKFVK